MEGDECEVEMWVKGLEKLPVEEFLPLVWLFCLFWEPLPFSSLRSFILAMIII